ncbi:hypothetical protein CRE_16204 [Caenorhabditis remanei]|uniref:Domain of unknown function WSN domain-containing protein n=1 Tax=Caenorhabditis remanei TaxID=31234 RepID=E3MSK2_CAERE|nr:hypothetical protein CRE_16204 [Caenorhabditis remanei]
MKVPSFTRFVVIITAIVSTSVPINAIESLDLSFVNKGFKNENSSNVIDRLAATARVITAITLQNGLSDKSISVDDVIAELLNFEPHELKNLETLDKKTVENFLTKFEDFKLNDGTVEAVTTLGNMHKFKEMWTQLGDTIDFPNDATYKQLDNIKSLQVSDLDKLDFKPTIDILNQSVLTEKHLAEVKTHLNSITTKIESIKGDVDIDGLINILNQLKPLQFVVQVFTIYGEMNAFTNLHQSVSDGLVQELGELKDLVAQSKSSSLDSLAKLVSSRYVHYPIDRMYTSGFINGYKDLNLLSVDETWLFNSTTLRNMKGIHQLSQTTSPFKKLDDEWNKMVSLETYKSVQDIASLQKLLLSITVVPSMTDVNQFIKDVKDCATASNPSMDVRKLKDISENTNTVFKKLTTIREALQSVEKLKSEYIPKLTTSTPFETIIKVKKLLIKLERDIQVLLVGESVVKVDMKIAASYPVTGFKKQFSSHIGSFDCIRDIKSRFGEVTLSAMSLDKIREMKKDAQVTKNVKDALAGASESLKSLTEIRSTFQSLKVQPIDTIPNALKNFSKPFGEAVAALVLGKSLMKKSSEFEMFVGNGYLVEGLVDARISDNFGKNWGDFVRTTENIKTLFTALTELIGKIDGSEKSKIEDVGSLFTNIPNLVDVDLLTDNRLNAVELFENIKPNPEQKLVDEFKNSLLELSKLDLKFSRFQKSLNSMSDTINKLVGIMSGISSQVTATTISDAVVESEGYKFIWWHGALLFTFVIFCAFLFCYVCCEIVDNEVVNDDVDIEKAKEKEQLVKTNEQKKEKDQKKKKSKGKKLSVFGKRLVWKHRSKKPNQKYAAVAQTPPPPHPNQTATASKSTDTAISSGSSTNNAASAVSKIDEVPIKAAENEKKKDADKDGKTGETDKTAAAAAATGDKNKAGGSVIPNKTGNNANKTCGNKTGVTEKPANDGKNLDDIFTFYGFVKPKSFPSSLKEQLWIEKTLFDIQQKIKEQREANRDPSTQSSSSSFHKGWTQEEAELNELSKQLKIRYKGLTGKVTNKNKKETMFFLQNLQEGIPEEEHVGRNEAKTVDDENYSFKQDIKK